MSKKSVYHSFIGLLALMLALMLIIDLLIPMPKEVRLTFYYIDIIVRFIFLGDYFVGLILAKNRRKYIVKNVLDFLTIVPVPLYFRMINIISLQLILSPDLIIYAIKISMILMLLIKFKIKVKEEIQTNRVYYLLILSTMIVVIGAIIISLIEGISLSDALWWSFVTFTTVGYGDVTLKTQLGRAIAVIIMFFGIGFIGVTTTALALYILDGGRFKKKYTYKEHVIEDIKGMLDDYKNLTNEDIDEIVEILKTLKDKSN